MAKHRLFKGSITALVTPFKDGAVDEAAFRAHVAWQVENGTDGLVPVGTTGESPTRNIAGWWRCASRRRRAACR